MKSIKLKVSKENILGKDTFFTTYDLLKMTINSPQEKGFDVNEMIQRLRLLNKLEEHKDVFAVKEGEFKESDLQTTAVLELEDADFAKLKELFTQMKWGVVSQVIVDLHNEF
jgi:hypothetical protein